MCVKTSCIDSSSAGQEKSDTQRPRATLARLSVSKQSGHLCRIDITTNTRTFSFRSGIATMDVSRALAEYTCM